MNDLEVYSEAQLSGRLIKADERHIFSYRHDATEALSLTMPLRVESYASQGLHPIFQMNLPEGHLRQVIERATAKQYGSNDLSLLAILGNSQIGRIGYALSKQPFTKHLDALPDLKQLLGSDDATLFNQLLIRFASHSGVAGVQPKVLLNVESKASLPLQSYIVKSWGAEYPELACNEFVCLSFARSTGLQVPEMYLSNNAKLLVSKRFDLTGNGESIGFEDFCVLQGKGTREKYDASLEACANTIRHYVSPHYQQQALYDFFKLTLVNVLLRNGDAHLKNIGVIYKHLQQFHLGELPNTERKLAPFFDIISTTPYIPNDTMALSLTGSKRWPKWKVLQRFAKQHCALNTHKINQAADEVLQARVDIVPLLDQLTEKHLPFTKISEKIRVLLGQVF